ncbi:MAG TPA: DMT family transporter [Thermoleophilaceae bacterium]|jgi:transporter family-2 protein
MDKQGVAVAATVVAGGFIALQAPINAGLGGKVGKLPAATVSFTIGTIVLIAITLLFAGGFGNVGEARHLSWYYLLGGVLGAIYVTTALIAVRTLGAGGVTAATIAGQLAMSVTLDKLGVLGLAQRDITPTRLAGMVLLAAGTFLVVAK